MTPEDYALGREYFEDGCLCVRDKKIDKKPKEVSNPAAFRYYMDSCTCSRHPEYKYEE